MTKLAASIAVMHQVIAKGTTKELRIAARQLADDAQVTLRLCADAAEALDGIGGLSQNERAALVTRLRGI